MEWFSYVVAIILLISSIVSPWLVTRENNKHQLNIKKLDMYENEKRIALSNFINSSTTLINRPDLSQNLMEQLKSFNILLIYFKSISPTTNDKFIESVDAVKQDDCEENALLANSVLTNIVQELSKEIMKE